MCKRKKQSVKVKVENRIQENPKTKEGGVISDNDIELNVLRNSNVGDLKQKYGIK